MAQLPKPELRKETRIFKDRQVFLRKPHFPEHIPALIRNSSSTGAFLELRDYSFDSNQHFYVSVREKNLPEQNILATVVWTHLSLHHPRWGVPFGIGIQFLPGTDESEELCKQFAI